uniref:Pecanex-like protein n=1 Tax=Steinernema glaseri TaxID=37863 RepID=A0A1I8AMJ2_9BILA
HGGERIVHAWANSSSSHRSLVVVGSSLNCTFGNMSRENELYLLPVEIFPLINETISESHVDPPEDQPEDRPSDHSTESPSNNSQQVKEPDLSEPVEEPELGTTSLIALCVASVFLPASLSDLCFYAHADNLAILCSAVP